MKVYIETFGCTFNQADSQIMAGILKENKRIITESPDDADIIIMNTCYVKHPTEQKVLNKIQSIKNRFPSKKLIVSGCMVEIDPEKLEKAASDASWVGPHKIQSIENVIKSIQNGEVVRSVGHSKDPKVCLPKLRSNPLVHIIQICEGCDGTCSYCCTRFARGKLQSYPMEMIKNEAEQAVSDGCVEIQLTAQDSAAYGKDIGKSLHNLMDQISGIDGRFKVRVGMMHPKSMMEDVEGLIQSFKNEKYYKFIHVPIQSGNNRVLEDMNRCHKVEDFESIISRFRREIPDISVSTDVIVGYPTEEDQAFQDTVELIKNIRPDFLHISKYMHRPGTLSSRLCEIDQKIMKERSRLLTEIKSEIALENNQKLVGTHQKVLITNKGSKGGFVGRTDNYKTVIIEEASLGSFIDIVITDAKSTYLMGEKFHT